MSASPTDPSTAPILTRRRGWTLEITLNRPAVRNAVNHEMACRVGDALDELERDPDLRVAVLTGAGGSFSSGMDLRALSDGESAWMGERGFASISKRPPTKPLIAAVEGFAVAGGLEIALACDLIVAARDAYFSLPEVRRCLVPAGGGIVRLAQRVPDGIARELVLTGERIDAERAAAIGLVNRLADPGAALASARELADRIAANAPLALVAAKRIFDEREQWPAAELWSRQEAIALEVQSTRDAREGALAFLERREPVWSGE